MRNPNHTDSVLYRCEKCSRIFSAKNTTYYVQLLFKPVLCPYRGAKAIKINFISY